VTHAHSRNLLIFMHMQTGQENKQKNTFKKKNQQKPLAQQSPSLTHKSTHVYIGLATRFEAVFWARCASISVDKFVNLPGNLNDIFQTNFPRPTTTTTKSGNHPKEIQTMDKQRTTWVSCDAFNSWNGQLLSRNVDSIEQGPQKQVTILAISSGNGSSQQL